MKRRVRLFIGGLEVEFKTVPDILYNFKVDDITSPSAVKNSYSKTVTIPGTKQNNRIFDSFFLNDYKTQGTNFDATKKTEFTLYVDNEPYQTGYVRLDKVKQNKHYFEYECSLFGGLGEFFYNLSYKDSAQGEDERMKLSDLDYFIDEYDDTPQELGFQITKETVKEAWDDIDSYSSKWGTINFAPAYNGLPDDFDADKVLMNLYDGTTPNTGNTSGPVVRRTGRRDASIVSKVTSGGTTYTTYGGYAVAEMSREYTGAEMRDFRSYLQRPVIRVKKVIEAMCRPEANGGFQVELDPDWFYYDNCYWQDLWVTRPTLSSLDYVAKADDTGTTITKGTKTTQTITPSSTKDPGYEEKYNLNISGGVEDKPFDMRVNLNLKLGGVTAPTDKDLVLCAYYPSGGFTYPSAMLVQLVAYDAFGNPVAGSPVQYITSAYGIHREGRQVYTNFVEYSSWNYTQPYGNEYSKQAGNYFKYSGSTFQWDSNIQLDAKNIPAGSTVKVVVTELYKASGSPAGAKKLFYRYEQGGQQTTYTAYTFSDFDIEITDYKIAYQTSEGIRTGVEFTKKQLLDTDYSPADFLLSYMKIFGLYAICDNVQKKVSILTRHNFFKRDEIEDVQDLIDRSSVEITPLVFNSKWYDWNLEADESEYGKAYEDTYGKPYGRKKINTGYNFNKDTKEVLEGNIFKNAVQVLERSNAFCYIGEDTVLKSWMMPGYKYNLYATNDATDTYEVEVAASSTIDLYSGFTTGYLYYDMYDKVQLHSADNSPADGSNVLLIRTGNKSTSIGSIKIKYFISDDNSYMSILNDGRPCWLYSTLSGDSQGNSVCIFLDEIPYFSRYKVYTDSGYITRSLDFGKPDEIYIPGLYYRPGSTIYEEFWQDYISDLYNKDSRVMKCKMLIKEKPTVDWLRRFYVFDNAIWRMLSIEDYNAAVDKLTTVQFVRVQDIDNYDSVVVSEQPTITITLSTNEIGLTGGTVTYTVETSDGGRWYVERYDSDTTLSVTSGMGLTTGTWTIPANSSTSDLQRSIMVMADNASATATLTQKGVSLSISGPVETGDVPWTGGTRHFIVTSPDGPWTAQTPYTGIITNITPSAGTATTGTGVTVTATVGENQDPTSRQAYLTLVGPGGTTVRSGYLRQQAAQAATISVTPTYVRDFSAAGGLLTVDVYSTEDWRGYPTYPDRATISPSTGHSGTTQVSIMIEPNTGSERYMQFLFYRENSPSSDPANLTVWQKAYVAPPDILTFDILTDGTFTFEGRSTTGDEYRPTRLTISYRRNNLSWNSSVTGETLTLDVYEGDTITVSGNTSVYIVNDMYHRFGGTAYFNVSGPLDSLNGMGDYVPEAGAFYGMFRGSNVVDASRLILPTSDGLVYSSAHRNMFRECESLIAAPNLPGTSIGKQAYSYMFADCVSLSIPPVISATTLITDQYGGNNLEYMFRGCLNLRKSPELLPTTLPNYCYRGMFSECANLTSIKCLATTFGTDSTRSWVYDIPNRGTFTKASGVSWSRGDNGIPYGWTVVEV